MASKLCRCGRIVSKRCPSCDQHKERSRGKTADRGYDHAWRMLSERKRACDPLCEECLSNGRTTAATEVHHIRSIRTAPHLRLDWDNLLSVCSECHRTLEGDLP